MKAVMVYMTARNRKEAATIGRTLVEKKLAACANILGPIESFYRWEGKLCHDREVAFIAKTRADVLERLIVEVKALHSYQCPCIVSWPIGKGYAPYVRWLDEQCGVPPVRTRRSRRT